MLTLTRNRGAATYAQTLQNIPETQVTTLENGLRVASEESTQPTCTVSARQVKGLLGALSPACCRVTNPLEPKLFTETRLLLFVNWWGWWSSKSSSLNLYEACSQVQDSSVSLLLCKH